MESATQNPDFAHAIIQLLITQPDLLKRDRYIRYTGLLRRDHPDDADLMNLLASAEAAKNADLLADVNTKLALEQTEPSSTAVNTPTPTPSATPALGPYLTPGPNTSPTPVVDSSPTPGPGSSPTPSTNRDQTARRVLIAATYADSLTRTQALDLLAATEKSRLQEIIGSLPPEVKPAIPPRVYIHVAKQEDAGSTKLAEVRKAIRELPLRREKAQTRTIVPKTIVEKLAKAPETTQVKCYEGEESREMAQILVSKLIEMGFLKTKILPDKPTSTDLKETRDISSHLEVWFARGDFQ